MSATGNRRSSKLFTGYAPLREPATFEQQALDALFSNREPLGLENVYRCGGLSADGYVETTDGSKIPFEIKTTLSFGALSAACFQLVCLNIANKLNAKEGWIIYGGLCTQWKNRGKANDLVHAKYCISDFQVGIEFKFYKLENGRFVRDGV